MKALRLLFIAALAMCLLLIVARGQWEGNLTIGYQTWIIDLERAPVWTPPAIPSYAQFGGTFNELPKQSTPGLKISRVLRWDWMLLDFLIYLWGTTVAFGVFYLMIRGKQRDIVLHNGLFIAFGLTASAIVCVGLWIVLGGWGPPFPEFFGVVGIIAGLIMATRSYKKWKSKSLDAAAQQALGPDSP